MELLMLLVTLLNQLTKSQIRMNHIWELLIFNSGIIQDDEQDEDMISQYTNIYNAIEKWESDHRETEIFQQLAVSELFKQIIIMVNLYKLLNVLEQGMSLFQLNKWKTEGIWYPITQYKKESDEIQVVTNLFIPEQKEYHIQLSGNYPEESEAWDKFLEENQWKIYPLLANIMQVFLPTGNYQIMYTLYSQGFISVIAKPINK